MSAKKVLIGALVGAAAGGVLGIMFAPAKGSVTRNRFSKKKYNYSKELEEKFDELIDSITEQFESVVDEVNRMADTEKLKTQRTMSAGAEK
jgi:gas vesicle protein